MAIDATIPQGAMMRWSLIDANDSSVIPGFSELEDLEADLSIIDFKKYPMVQLKIQMESVSESPIIHSVKLGGGIIESFTINPTTNGWSGFSSHSNGKVTGNGMLYSPEWRLTHPFSAVDMFWSGTGSGNFEACFTDSNSCSSSGWTPIPSDGKLQMDHPSTTLNLRWSGSGSYSIDFIHVDLHRQSSPLNARIDIGLDGVSEWSFSNEMIGGWGLQDVFENGEKSVELDIAPSGTDVTALYYPIRTGPSDSSYESTGNMMLAFTAVGAPLNGVEVTFSIDGNDILTESLGFVQNSARITLSDIQMQDLVSEMDSRNTEMNIIGELDAHKIEISVSSSTGGTIQVSGLSIPYRYDAHIDGDAALPIIAAINSQLSQISSSNGMKEVPIPVVMENPGRLLIWDYGLQTLGSPLPTGITMSNQTDTLVAGNDWYEFNSSFDLSNIGISDASGQFNG